MGVKRLDSVILPHSTHVLACPGIFEEKSFCPPCEYTGVDDYCNTRFPLCVLQLGSVPQDLAPLLHALRSPRHLHPHLQPTVVEQAAHWDDS